MHSALQPSLVVLKHCVFSLLLAALVCGNALAQSGRGRTGSSVPTGPPPADSNKPTADNSSSASNTPVKKIKLTAAKYVSAANMAFETGVAFRSFLTRLEESGFLIVSARDDVRRKEAIELAKRSENIYVAWLALELDLMGSADARNDNEKASITTINPGCLFVTYAIYEAGTGRAIAQGRTYQKGYQDRCAGTVYHPSPYPDRKVLSPRGTLPELELKRAGSEAADRIMEALNIVVPTKHPQ